MESIVNRDMSKVIIRGVDSVLVSGMQERCAGWYAWGMWALIPSCVTCGDLIRKKCGSVMRSVTILHAVCPVGMKHCIQTCKSIDIVNLCSVLINVTSECDWLRGWGWSYSESQEQRKTFMELIPLVTVRLSQHMKGRLYVACVKSVLLYGGESWVIKDDVRVRVCRN